MIATLLAFALRNWQLIAGIAALSALYLAYEGKLHAEHKAGYAEATQEQEERQAELQRIDRSARARQQVVSDAEGRKALAARLRLEESLKRLKVEHYEAIIDTAGRCVVAGGLRDDYNSIVRDGAGEGDGAGRGATGDTARPETTTVDVTRDLLPTCQHNAAVGAYCCNIAQRWQEWWRGQQTAEPSK
jgi:hypothetical protein